MPVESDPLQERKGGGNHYAGKKGGKKSLCRKERGEKSLGRKKNHKTIMEERKGKTNHDDALLKNTFYTTREHILSH